MNLYQQEHSVFEEHFAVERKNNFSFPIHLHRSYEFLYILDGQMEICLDDEVKVLKKNDCVIIFPYQLHSLKSDKSEHILFIFSSDYVEHFGRYMEGKKLSSNFFSVEDETFLNMLLAIDNQDNLYKIKGVLYFICGYCLEKCVIDEHNKEKYNSSARSLLKDVVDYVAKNYKNDISLIDLSKRISYDYTYLSKFFQEKTGMPFNTYVNHLRINEACFLLSETSQSILEIALLCGYNSVRSFNRNFRKLRGSTPTDYRMNLNKIKR